MLKIGDTVQHSKYPSMLYDHVGTIVANAGTKYKRQYWTVEYRNANGHMVRTDFWDFVLAPVSWKPAGQTKSGLNKVEWK